MLTSSFLANITLVGIILLMAAHAVYVNKKRGWLAFDPLNTFWAGAVVVYVVQPITYSKQFILWYGTDTFDDTLLWALFGFIFLVIGYESNLGVRWSVAIPRFPERLHPTKLIVSALGLCLVGVGAYIYMVMVAGGLDAWAALGTSKSIEGLVPSYVRMLAQMLFVGVSLALFHAQIHNPPLLRKALIWVLAALLLLFYFYIGTRSRVVGLIIVIMAAYYLPRLRNPPVVILASIFIVLMFVVNLMAAYRGEFNNFSFNIDESQVENVLESTFPVVFGNDSGMNAVGARRGAEFSCSMAAVDLVPGQVPYNYGYSELQFFTQLVPRAIWPEKIYPQYEAFTPIYAKGDLGASWVPNSYVPILAGPAFGYVGHWYAVGGAVALILAGFITGGLYRMLREGFVRAMPNESVVLLYTPLLIIGFLDASATPFFWLFSVPPVLLATYILIKLIALPQSGRS